MNGMIVLESATTSLVLEPVEGGAPLWRWWGPRVDATALPPLAAARPAASFSLDVDQPS